MLAGAHAQPAVALALGALQLWSGRRTAVSLTRQTLSTLRSMRGGVHEKRDDKEDRDDGTQA